VDVLYEGLFFFSSFFVKTSSFQAS